MNRLAISAILFIISIVAVGADRKYRYYYYRPSSLSSTDSRISRLEKEVRSLNKPVHVHVHGNGQGSQPQLEGTHVYVHLSLDGHTTGQSMGGPMSNEYVNASCQLQPNSARSPSGEVKGFVYLRQKPSKELEVKLSITGFPRAGLYGFHVHELSDFSNGCNSFGGHFNPFGKVHGGPSDDIRHVGDWGNINANVRGVVNTEFKDRLATLFGENSIVGRGIVVHAGTDDLGRGGDAGSSKTGNAGPRLACCVVGWA